MQGRHRALRYNEMAPLGLNCGRTDIVKNTDRAVKAALQADSLEYYLCSLNQCALPNGNLHFRQRAPYVLFAGALRNRGQAIDGLLPKRA